MSRYEKLLFKLLTSNGDKNFSFSDLVKILQTHGFDVRIKGSHHIFFKNGIEEIINIQESDSGKAKPYQVKQVREIFIKYGIVKEDTDDNG